ncbi:hypothetical protein DIPPA_23166 [Diplonema papillatum]|nr:hypothetical protein DIPPA_23166 [Diplonema papillatum]
MMGDDPTTLEAVVVEREEEQPRETVNRLCDELTRLRRELEDKQAAVASLYAALLAAVPARHHEHLFPAASCSPKTEAPPLQALLDLPSRVHG